MSGRMMFVLPQSTRGTYHDAAPSCTDRRKRDQATKSKGEKDQTCDNREKHKERSVKKQKSQTSKRNEVEGGR